MNTLFFVQFQGHAAPMLFVTIPAENLKWCWLYPDGWLTISPACVCVFSSMHKHTGIKPLFWSVFACFWHTSIKLQLWSVFCVFSSMHKHTCIKLQLWSVFAYLWAWECVCVPLSMHKHIPNKLLLWRVFRLGLFWEQIWACICVCLALCSISASQKQEQQQRDSYSNGSRTMWKDYKYFCVLFSDILIPG
jgi:hypothetical protein